MDAATASTSAGNRYVLESDPLLLPAPPDVDAVPVSGKSVDGIAESSAQRAARLRRYRITVALLVAAAAVAAVVLLSILGAWERYLELLVLLEDHPRRGSWVMIGVIAAGTVVCLSGNLLWASAGFVLRPYPLAVLVSVAGGALGVSIAFGIGRFTLRSWVKDEVAARPKCVIIDRAVCRRGFRVMLALRLALFPYNIGNYLFSSSGVRYADYLTATIGVVPTILVFAYLGSLARDIESFSRGEMQGTTGYVVIVAVTLSLLVGVLVGVFVWARNVVKEELEQDQDQNSMASNDGLS